jgi:hypothetical protein
MESLYQHGHMNYFVTEQKVCKGKGKGKVPVLLLTEHHAMKACWESGGIAPLIL